MDAINTGNIIFDGKNINSLPPNRRQLNTVFQKYALFPHLSVYENIAFGLKLKKMSKDIIEQKVMKMLKLIGLEGYEDKNTTLLSGGQQQRVAIARALVNEPKVLLLDEPTRGIDVGAKYEIYQLIIDLANRGKVVIVVSSEMPELLGICDRIMVLPGGRLAGEINAEEATQELIMTYAAKYV